MTRGRRSSHFFHLVGLSLVGTLLAGVPLAQSLAFLGDSKTIGSNALTSGSWSSANYATYYLHDNPTPPTGDTTTTTTATATSAKTRTGYVVATAPAAPVADFGAGPLKIDGCSGTVSFVDASTNKPTSWAWDFDNNGSTDSTAQNPSFTYTACGVYAVNLTATNGSGSNSVTRSNLVELRATSPTTQLCTTNSGSGWSNRQNACSDTDGDAYASATPTLAGTISTDWGGFFSLAGIPTDATITQVQAQANWRQTGTTALTDLSLELQLYNNGIAQGTKTTATDRTFTQRSQTVTSGFTRADLIGDNLKVRVGCVVPLAGLLRECDLDWVKVEVTFTEPSIPAAPTASFSGSPLSVEQGSAVSFTDTSAGTIDRWIWDFDNDGKTDAVSSSAANQSYTFAGPGTYTAKLTVTGQGGTNAQTRTSYVTVTIPPVPGAANTAEFYGTPVRGTASLSVSFTDRSSGTPVAWAWDFGDGGSSTSQNPSHSYGSAGTYTVVMTTTYDTGVVIPKPLYMNDTSSVTATLHKYSTDVDAAAPGRVVRRGGTGASESRSGYFVAWKSSTFASARAINGNVLVATWGTLATYSSGKGVGTIYLRDYDTSGGTYAEIAAETLTLASWNAGTGGFCERDFAVHVGSYTIAAGHQLEVKLVVGTGSDADMWFAYDTTAYPAYTRLP